MSAKLQEKIERLWEKYSTYNGYGRAELMFHDDFEKAIREVVPEWNPYPAIKPEQGQKCWIYGHGGCKVPQLVRYSIGAFRVQRGNIQSKVCPTHWLPFKAPEAP